MLHYNNPDRAIERAEAQPLSIDEDRFVVETIDQLLSQNDSVTINSEDEKLIQRFIDNHENMQHQLAVAGGPDGITKLLQRSDAIYELYEKLKQVVAELEKHEPAMMIDAVITAHKVTLDSLRQMLIKTAYNANDDFEKNL